MTRIQTLNAELIETVEKLDEKYLNMAKDTTGSDVGTGGMATKLNAARIASYSGAGYDHCQCERCRCPA